MLTKTTRWLILTHDDEAITGRPLASVIFTPPRDGDEPPPSDRHVAVQLAWPVWDEMGNPTELTVTIVPGDALNDD